MKIRTLISTKTRRVVPFLVAALLMMAAPLISRADPPTYTPQTYAIDWAGVAGNVGTNAAGAFSGALPYAAALMALFIGWRVVSRVMHAH